MEAEFFIDLNKIPLANVTGLETQLATIEQEIASIPPPGIPGQHTHAETDITNLVTDLSGKAASTHAHSQTDVTGLQTALDGKAASSHAHAITDVTNLQTTLNGKEAANVNIQTHVTSQHAPANAQKNSDIIQSEIEAKLTGAISTHSHAGGSGQPIGYVVLANDTLAQALATNINTQITVTAARTLTTTVPAAGVGCSVVVVTSGTVSFVVTFGTGFKPVGTLATGTVAARAFVVNFISNGTILRESGRTAAMVV